MSEILEEAQKRGFDLTPWEGSWHSWNNGVEVAAIEYLKYHASDLYDENEE
jgi:hypothetical protein